MFGSRRDAAAISVCPIASASASVSCGDDHSASGRDDRAPGKGGQGVSARTGCSGCAELTDNMPCNGAWMVPQQRVEIIVRIR